jgi:hypothetical protein
MTHQEEDNMQTNPPDRLNMRVWLMLVIVGVVLALAGWYNYVY